MACVGEIKAVFWARGVENIYMETPVETYKVLKSSEGYWIGKLELDPQKTYKFLKSSDPSV